MYVYRSLTVNNSYSLPTKCIAIFNPIPKTNIDYFPMHHNRESFIDTKFWTCPSSRSQKRRTITGPLTKSSSFCSSNRSDVSPPSCLKTERGAVPKHYTVNRLSHHRPYNAKCNMALSEPFRIGWSL
jgi:hypothetical protein